MSEDSSTSLPGMHPRGQRAWDHWRTWRPNELSRIPNPEAFFSRLGQEATEQIDQVSAALAGDDPGGEEYLAKVGRLRMARSTAESQVLRELVLLPPEPGHPEYDPEDDPDRQPSRYPADAPWEPLGGVTPDDPSYHQLDDDPFLSTMAAAPATRNARANPQP